MFTTAPLSVVWSDFKTYYERVIDSANEASLLITTLRASNINPPAMVEFFEPESGKALSIGVGRDDTVITFQESLDPPYYISLGNVRDDGVTSFCYGRDETEYANQNRIPFSLGFDALLFFVHQRSRPPGIDWERL